MVATNLYDGLDWYSISDRLFTRTSPLKIRVNVAIPVIFIHCGSALLIGGTSGCAKVYDARTSETLQNLDHDGELCFFVYGLRFSLTCSTIFSRRHRSGVGRLFLSILMRY